jgi:hypothetical protein
MTTIANQAYDFVDVDSDEGVYQQIANFCANHECDIELFESNQVIFYDGSAISYDDDSVAIAGC